MNFSVSSRVLVQSVDFFNPIKRIWVLISLTVCLLLLSSHSPFFAVALHYSREKKRRPKSLCEQTSSLHNASFETNKFYLFSSAVLLAGAAAVARKKQQNKKYFMWFDLENAHKACCYACCCCNLSLSHPPLHKNNDDIKQADFNGRWR